MARASSLTRLQPQDYPEAQSRLVNDLNPFLASINQALGGGLGFENLRQAVREITVTMPADATAPTLAGTWVAQTTVGYVKDVNGIVRLSGVLTGGTYGTTAIFTLPSDFCPAEFKPFPVAQSALSEPQGLLQIFATGEVVAPVVTSVQSGTSTYLSLEGVSFQAADNSAGLPGAPFPITVSRGALAQVRSALVIDCYDWTSGSPVGAPYPSISWQPTAAGISLTRLVGLSPNRTYKLRLLLFPF